MDATPDATLRPSTRTPAYYPVRDPDSERAVFTAITAIPQYAAESFEELRYNDLNRSIAALSLGDTAATATGTFVAQDYRDYGRVFQSVTAYEHMSFEELRYIAANPTVSATFGHQSSPPASPTPTVGSFGPNLPRVEPTLVEPQTTTNWPFTHALTAMDAFKSKSFEELRLEDRNAPIDWRLVVAATKRSPIVSLMELRVRDVVSRLMDDTPQWWTQEWTIQQIQSLTTEWCALTVQETLNSWYPTSNHVRFRTFMDASGTDVMVPASLDWIDPAQFVVARMMNQPEAPVLDAIDSFAFVGYYCVQARIATRQREDGFQWARARDDLLEGIGDLAATLVTRLLATKDSTDRVIQVILQVLETRPEILEALRTHVQRIQHYLGSCEQFALGVLEHRSREVLARAVFDGVVETGIDTVFVCDDNSAMSGELCKQVERLQRDSPAGSHDWLPVDEDDLILLVDPFLLAADATTRRVPCFTSIEHARALDPFTRMSEIAFQNTIAVSQYVVNRWLPSDVLVDADGNAVFASYIHNVHPKTCRSLYQALEKVLSRMLPSFERVVWSLKRAHPLSPWFDEITPLPSYIRYCLCQRPTPPIDRPLPLRPSLPTIWNLHGSHLQVVVGMEEIHVSASLPTYTENGWDGLGLAHENVAAVGLFCYGAENIAGASLGFDCTVACDPNAMGNLPCDSTTIAAFYGFQHDETRFFPSQAPLRVGSVSIREGRSIVWPTAYRTRVERVEWDGQHERGSLKLVWFYLVSPGTEVLSTADVPPRQPGWSTVSTDELANRFELPESAVELILAFAHAHFSTSSSTD